MAKVILIDNRKSIIELAKSLGLKAIWGDYFKESAQFTRHVLVSASNPIFTFGGGLDRELAYNFPFYCELKKKTVFKGNERIGNVCFTITVDERLESNKELVREAIRFSIKNTSDNETLCISGLGTGIGRLSEKDFVEMLIEEIGENKTGGA